MRRCTYVNKRFIFNYLMSTNTPSIVPTVQITIAKDILIKVKNIN